MKLATYSLILFMLFIPFQSVAAKKPESKQVILTASQVAGANDIEAAIISATAGGTRPGTVILDGRGGPFVLSAPDKSLNIFVSSLTLRGENHASIVNCDDGLFFEGSTIQDILVENISFNCTGDGVEASGAFKDVTLRKNNFHAGKNGIVMSGSSSGWIITENVIQGGLDGIRISGASNFVISKNDVSGAIGIVLLGSSHSELRQNTIRATYQGILLGQEAWKNIVQANKILGVSQAGVALEPGVTGNRVLANKVTCAVRSGCLAVDFSPQAGKSNKITGNSRK